MIKHMENSNIEEVAKLIVEDWKLAYKGIIDKKYLEKLDYTKKASSLRARYKEQKAIIYVESGKIKGYCRFGETIDNKEKYGEIIALYVKYDEKRKGIGKILVKEAMKILKEKGYKEVIIWCLKENLVAREFYKKIGGKMYKERYIKIGEKEYEEVSYIYNIENFFSRGGTYKYEN